MSGSQMRPLGEKVEAKTIEPLIFCYEAHENQRKNQSFCSTISMILYFLSLTWSIVDHLIFIPCASRMSWERSVNLQNVWGWPKPCVTSQPVSFSSQRWSYVSMLSHLVFLCVTFGDNLPHHQPPLLLFNTWILLQHTYMHFSWKPF